MLPIEEDDIVVNKARLDDLAGLILSAAHAARDGVPHPVIVLSGPAGAGRKTLLAAAATRNGLASLRVRCATLPRSEAPLRALGAALVREAILWRAVLLLDAPDRELESGLMLDELLLGGFAGPVAAVVGKIAGHPPRFERGVVLFDVGIPDRATREQLWARALSGASAAAWAAERYNVTPGVIRSAARAAHARATARARAGGDSQVTTNDVHEGVRGALDAKLSTLGQRITWQQTWDDVVLPDDIMSEIREFIARVRHRKLVLDQWGFGRKIAKGMGLSALFSGPPGTGKTMVAKLIADELGLDLYQVDLSRIVSKWVGETEKNLGELFEAAEAGHAVLLFDEADSLFTKRTDVKSSNDRYANLEVNYLLQRLESFAGITILTTNNESAIDEAFRRRLTLRVDFPVPEADERAKLWESMLPAGASVAGAINFEELADKYEMSGGYIRNAVVRAAYIAADEGHPITMNHLRRAADLEYQAMGKLVLHRR
jgi:DNA polymerase III delta prime subunit